MPRNLVLNDGVLSAEVISYEPVELEQLKASVTDRADAADVAVAELIATPADNPDALVAAAKKRDEAQAALADAKSEHGVGSKLVEAAAEAAGTLAAESSPDGADGETKNPESQQF